jgi:two-component system sensor histidine kinase KdpD
LQNLYLRSLKHARSLLLCTAFLAAAILAAEALQLVFGPLRIGVLFLAAVVTTAIACGPWHAIFQAFVAAAAYNVLLEPRYQLHLGPEDGLNVGIFLILAIAVGNLTGKLRETAELSHRRATTLHTLVHSARLFAEAHAEEEVWERLRLAVEDLAGSVGFVVVDASLTVRASSSSDAAELAAAALKAALNRPADVVQEGGWLARALVDSKIVGVAAWSESLWQKGPETREVLLVLTEFAASTLKRISTVDANAALRTEAHHSDFRETLISSVSHDFRSPLAAIIGSATSLLDFGDRFTPEIRSDLLCNIRDEGERLNRFVENLLDLGRLQAGSLRLEPVAINLIHICNRVTERLAPHYPDRVVEVSTPLPIFAQADPLLVEQAIENVLHNALKFTPPSGLIVVETLADARWAEVKISDSGPGASHAQQEEMFGRFKSNGSPGGERGVGLGLAISKGFVEANNGRLSAEARPDGKSGLVMRIQLPIAIEPLC